MSEPKITKKDLMVWAIVVGGWVFSCGGAYFMLKDHDRRIVNLEAKDDKRVSKEEFESRLKDIRWNSRGR